MNDAEKIEELLRKAPQAKAPAGLLEKLQDEIVLPRAQAVEPRRHQGHPLLQRWFPSLSFGLLFVTGVVVLAVETSRLVDLRQANARLRTSVAGLEELRRQNAELQQLRSTAQEAQRVQKEHAELLKLRAEVSGLRGVTQELPGLRAESRRLQAQRALALAGTLSPNEPRIQFSETTFDFGEVNSIDTVKHEFVVINTGNAMLEITSVMPGCGCTTAGGWDRRIEPGKTGIIPIAFNPANFSGPITKAITVTCNDPAQAMHRLQIQATVWRPLEVQPRQVYFLPPEDEPTNETKVVRIINNTEEFVTVQPPDSTSPVFQAELRTVRPGKEFELHVTYLGPVSNAEHQASLNLHTSLPTVPALNIPVSATPQPAIVATPSRIELPPGPYTAPYPLSVAIRYRGPTGVKLFEPVVNAAGVASKLEEIVPGKNFRLDLSFPSDFQIQAGAPLELSVRTSHPKYPVLKVPIVSAAPKTRSAMPVPQ